jgi:hypothetical protein
MEEEQEHDGADDPAQAFEALRAEVAALRQAIGGCRPAGHVLVSSPTRISLAPLRSVSLNSFATMPLSDRGQIVWCDSLADAPARAVAAQASITGPSFLARSNETSKFPT